MKFSKYPFSEPVKANLASLNFTKPTDIQYKSIAPILNGEDLLAVAQTGTGKTAAFAIPLIDTIHRLKHSSRSEGVAALILVPTRELALQIESVFHAIAAKTRVRCFAVVGGSRVEEQEAVLAGGIDILTATPGRLFDLIHRKDLSLSAVRFLVLDEADRMLEPAFIRDILYVKKLILHSHQTLFFTATLNEEIKKLAYSLIRGNAIRIQISPKDKVSKNILHKVLTVEADDKRFFLERFFLDHPGEKMIVFVRTRVRAERVAKAMGRVGIEALVLHGEREQEDREAVMEAFRRGSGLLLIATDVSARGIDIPDIRYVINYDLPDRGETYVHRVGRTGRGWNKGIALSFCTPEEKPKLAAIEAFLGKPIEGVPLAPKGYRLWLEERVRPFAWAEELEAEMRFLSPKKPKKPKPKRPKPAKSKRSSSGPRPSASGTHAGGRG